MTLITGFARFRVFMALRKKDASLFRLQIINT